MSNGSRPPSVWTRTREMYQRLALSLRLGIALVAGLALIGFAYWTTTSREADSVYLLGGQQFNEAQIQSFCRALESEGLTAFQVEGSRLRIPKAQVAQYAAALAKREVLPASFYAAFDKAAQQTNWWSSTVQEDRRWELAHQKSLAQIIESMPDIESATVLIDRSAPRGLRGDADIRATVAVTPRTGHELPPHRVRQIRNLIAGAVAKLQPENVAVVDLSGKTLVELGSGGSGAEDRLDKIKEYEAHFSQNIRNVLAYIPEVNVTVNVELDAVGEHRAESLPSAGADATNVAAPRPDADVHPTVSANRATELVSAPSSAPRQPVARTASSSREAQNALAPTNVTVAITIPQDVVATLAPAGSSAGSAAETWTARIKDQVAHAIPAGLKPNISVQLYRRPVSATASKPAAESAAEESGRVLWAVATGLGVFAVGFLGIGGWKWQRSRRARASGRPELRELPAAARTTHDRSAGDAGGDLKELIRIERSSGAARPSAHLRQSAWNGFEDLRRLAPASLQALFSEVDGRLWAPALRGGSRELCDRILTHMPSRAAMLLRDEMEYLGPVRLGDVEAAQQEILEVVRRLDHAGDLVMEDREEARRD